MTRSQAWLRGILLLLGAFAPAVALACPACNGPGGDSPSQAAAFFNTTILLSLLPLGLIGGGVLWLKRDARDFLSTEFEERDPFEPRVIESGSTPRDGEPEQEPRA